mgnify:CR=1 FL=1
MQNDPKMPDVPLSAFGPPWRFAVSPMRLDDRTEGALHRV